MAQYTRNATTVGYSNIWYDTSVGRGSQGNSNRIGQEGNWRYVTRVELTLPSFGRSESIKLTLAASQVAIMSAARTVQYAISTSADISPYAGQTGAVSAAGQIVTGAWQYPGSDKATVTADVTISTEGLTSGGTVYVYMWGGARGLVVSSLTADVNGNDVYTISYNANGGSGAPGNQQKVYGTALTLSSTVPTKTGFWFREWRTARDGSGDRYTPGDGYTKNAGATLYAIWGANEYSYSESKGRGTSIRTARTGSPNANAALKDITTADKVYYGDILKVYISADDGYTLGMHTVNNQEVSYGGQYTVSQNVTVAATATVKAYSLSINAGAGVSVTVNRTSSPIGQGKTGNLTTNDRLYTGDVLEISAAAGTGYNVSSLKVNGKAHQSGTSITVSVDVDVEATADANAYRLTIQAGEGSSITVRRTGGSTTGILTDGDSIYYGDTLEISAAAAEKYELVSLTANGEAHQSGESITVIEAVTVAAAAKKKMERLISIRHNGQWKLYRADIRKNGNWVLYAEQHRRKQ